MTSELQIARLTPLFNSSLLAQHIIALRRARYLYDSDSQGATTVSKVSCGESRKFDSSFLRYGRIQRWLYEVVSTLF
jgi:hypothetical protein